MTIDFHDYENSDKANETFVFHYTKRDIALEKILPNQLLKFSNRKKSHDPLEREEFTFTTHTNAAGDKQVVIREAMKNLEFGKLVNKARNETKYACFSKDKGIVLGNSWRRGCFRSRMWSQYAENHMGICIVLDKLLLRKMVSNFLTSYSEKFILSGSVKYKNYDKSIVDVSHLSPADTIGNPIKYLKQYAASFLYRKIKDYENEQEYRISYYNKSNKSDLVPISGSIAGLLLGQYCDSDSKKRAIEFGIKLNIPVSSVLWFRGSPSFGRET